MFVLLHTIKQGAHSNAPHPSLSIGQEAAAMMHRRKAGAANIPQCLVTATSSVAMGGKP
jgi:hypothetical protein